MKIAAKEVKPSIKNFHLLSGYCVCVPESDAQWGRIFLEVADVFLSSQTESTVLMKLKRSKFRSFCEIYPEVEQSVRVLLT